MEFHEKRSNSPPSFSSTLLDTIYRSIDEDDSRLHRPSLDRRRAESFRCTSSGHNWKLLLLHHHQYQDDAALTPATPSDLHYLCKPRQHLRYLQQQRRDPFVLPSSSSSSSSDSDSTGVRRPRPPLCPNGAPTAADAKRAAKGAKSKTPSSTGGRIARFLHGLLRRARGEGRRRRPSAEERVREAAEEGEEEGDLFELEGWRVPAGMGRVA